MQLTFSPCQGKKSRQKNQGAAMAVGPTLTNLSAANRQPRVTLTLQSSQWISKAAPIGIRGMKHVSTYLKRPKPLRLVFFSRSSAGSSAFFLPLLFFSFFFPLVFFFFLAPSSTSRPWRDEPLAGVSWPELCSDRSSSEETRCVVS